MKINFIFALINATTTVLFVHLEQTTLAIISAFATGFCLSSALHQQHLRRR